MANPTIAPAAPTQSVKPPSGPSSAPVKLPEAFRAPVEPSTPAPEMDAFAELEQIDAKNPADYSRPPKKTSEADKPAANSPEKAPESKADPKTPAADAKTPQDKAKTPETPKDTKEDDKASAPATDDKGLPVDDPSKKFQLASELRKDYRRLHEENQKLAAELKQARNGKPEATEERKALDTKLETLEKRNRELEEEISYRDYTKSSEFQEKFKKPFETKLASVYRQISDLSVLNEDGTERAATREDFDKVLESPSSTARAIAKSIFGDDFREVLQYRRELNELQQNADEEMKGWREKAKEREQSQAVEQRKMREEAEGVFKKSLDTYVEKYPEWFGEIEGDEELNKALQQGFAATDRSQDRNVPLAERLDLLAAARLKAASFGRHVITIKRLKAKVAELEESLKAYDQSTPGEGQGQRASTVSNGTGDDVPSANDEIEAIERRNPIR